MGKTMKKVPDLAHPYAVYNNYKPGWVNVDDNRYYLWWGANLIPVDKPFFPRDLWTDDKRNRYNRMSVPFEYGHLVCQCPESKRRLRPLKPWSVDSELGSKLIKCKTCDKWAKYLLITCSTCREYFFNIFRHPFQCFRAQECWGCVSKRTEPPCAHGSIDSPYTCVWIRTYRDTEPVAPPEIDMTERSKEFDFSIPKI